MTKRLTLLGVLFYMTIGQAWATDWYVRPNGYKVCGTCTGVSYDNAYEGFDGITWGAEGVTFSGVSIQ